MTHSEPTPKQLGYRLPAEWEEHEATWLSWPHKEASWPGRIAGIFPVYAQMVAALARSEAVHINVNDAKAETNARHHLERPEPVGPEPRSISITSQQTTLGAATTVLSS